MRRGGWREHVRAELQAREGRWRGLRRLLERRERGRGCGEGRGGAAGSAERAATGAGLEFPLRSADEQLRERLEAQRSGGGASGPPVEPAVLQVKLRREEGELRQEVALLADLLRSAEAESREHRARMGCLARDLAALTRQHQEAESRAWRFAQENEALRTELAQARALLQEAQAGRLTLEARWLREKALEATRVNWANEQEEKYRRNMTRLQERLAKARDQTGRPAVDLDGGVARSFSTSSEEAEWVAGAGSQPAARPDPVPWEGRAHLEEGQLLGAA
ncbi:uncharacterized protein M6D78_017446 [Vipera latastei]